MLKRMGTAITGIKATKQQKALNGHNNKGSSGVLQQPKEVQVEKRLWPDASAKCRPSPEMAVLMQHGHFNTACLFPPKVALPNGHNGGPGTLFQINLGFPQCHFGVHKPRKANSQTTLGLLVRCGCLDRPCQCRQRLLKGWLKSLYDHTH